MVILIVEDEPKVASFVKKGLEENKYDAEIAYDGLSAEKLVQQKHYDLFILDIIIPGINGLDLCRKLKKLNPNTPVLMLTALGTTDDKINGFDAGANDYLVKPFEFRELLARVKVLLKKPDLAPESENILRVDDLELNWKEQFSNSNENSKEAILVAVNSISSSFPSRGYTLHYLDPQALGIPGGANNGICGLPDYVKSFDPDDKRYLGSFLIGPMISLTTGQVLITAHGRPLIHTVDVTMKYSIDADGWGQTEQEDGARFNKWEFKKGLTAMENDCAIYRLADVYLMKAECFVRLGQNNTEATRLVNELRKRAFTDPAKLKTSVTLDDIYNERRFELAWENWGRQDMIRFGTFLNPIPVWRPKALPEFRLLFPIPQTALDANPSLKQNPGY